LASFQKVFSNEIYKPFSSREYFSGPQSHLKYSFHPFTSLVPFFTTRRILYFTERKKKYLIKTKTLLILEREFY